MRAGAGSLLPLLLSGAAAGAGSDADTRPLLAVLEFTNKLQKSDQVDAAYFSDEVRGAALAAAPGVRVITRESLVALLTATGKSLDECLGECEVETGRRIGADYVASGMLVRIGTTFHLTLKLHETRGANLLATAKASGKTVDELDASTASAARVLFATLGKPPDPAGDVKARAQETMDEMEKRPGPPVAAPSEPAPEQRPPEPKTAPSEPSASKEPPQPGPIREREEPRRAEAPPAALAPPATPGIQGDGRTTWRRVGFGLIGAGALAGAGSGIFALLGKSQNDKIKSGGFVTSQALLDAESAGQRHNSFAIGFGIGAAAALAIGVPMVLLHGDRAQASVAVQPAGLAFAARFP